MFSVLKPLPTDPILGLMAAYKQDTNPNKIDLGVGVYKDEQGNTPVLKSVKKAEACLPLFNAQQQCIGIVDGEAFNTDFFDKATLALLIACCIKIPHFLV